MKGETKTLRRLMLIDRLYERSLGPRRLAHFRRGAARGELGNMMEHLQGQGMALMFLRKPMDKPVSVDGLFPAVLRAFMEDAHMQMMCDWPDKSAVRSVLRVKNEGKRGNVIRVRLSIEAKNPAELRRL